MMNFRKQLAKEKLRSYCEDIAKQSIVMRHNLEDMSRLVYHKLELKEIMDSIDETLLEMQDLEKNLNQKNK